MTYIIKRNGKRFNSKTFSEYEQARTYLRKWLRKKDGLAVHQVPYDKGWTQHRNPSISDYGFSVERKTC
jgi:hypothetical protein